MPLFGQLITGLPPSDGRALAAGWAYHFWNGLSFGKVYALLRPRGGVASGLVWGHRAPPADDGVLPAPAPGAPRRSRVHGQRDRRPLAVGLRPWAPRPPV